MSVIDEIKARLAALEAGGDLAQRLAAIEEVLGLTPATAPATQGTTHCERCGMDQTKAAGFSCPQAKCPIR